MSEGSGEIDARINAIGNLVIVTGSLPLGVKEYNFNSLVSKVYAFDILFEQSPDIVGPLTWPFMDSTDGGFNTESNYNNLPFIKTYFEVEGEQIFADSHIHTGPTMSLIGDTIIQFYKDVDHPTKVFSATESDHKLKFMLIGRR